MEIRKMINLMESVLQEGVHDNIIKEFTNGVRQRYPDDERMLGFCDTIDKRWEDDIRPKVAKFPNTWKQYIATYLKFVMIVSIKKQYPDFKFKNNFPKYMREMLKININGLITGFEHYLYMDTEEVLKFNPFNSENPLKDLEKIEDDYKDSLGSDAKFIDMSEDNTDAEVLIDFKNGFKWFDLQKPYCTAEGDAMGHCGNKPSAEYSHTVFSLRKKVPSKNGMIYQPALTFIYDKDTELLGEMKGRANEKPTKRYHKYIIELLKKPYIKGFGNGGYEPQNNFAMEDLTDEQQQEIREIKNDPDFGKPRLEDYEWVESVKNGKVTFYMSDLFYGFDNADPIKAYNSDEDRYGYDGEIEDDYMESVFDFLINYHDGKSTIIEWMKRVDEVHYNENFKDTDFFGGDIVEDEVYGQIVRDNEYTFYITMLNTTSETQLNDALSDYFSDFIDLDKYPLYNVLSTNLVMDVQDVRDMLSYMEDKGIIDNPSEGDQDGEFVSHLSHKVSSEYDPDPYDSKTALSLIEGELLDE